MKKILVFVGGTVVSGAERVTLDVISGLKNKGHEVACISNGWNDGDFNQRLAELNIHFYTIKLGWLYLSKLLWTLDSLIHLPKALWDGMKILKKNRPDWIYAANFRQLFWLNPFIKAPIIYHVHDPNGHDRIATFALKYLDKKIYKYLAVSKSIQEDLLKIGIKAEKITLIYNGVDIPATGLDFSPDASILHLGIVGQVIPRKGHEDLIEALYCLKSKGISNFQLHIVGKGDVGFISKLKEKIVAYDLEEQVFWRGFQKSSQDIYSGVNLVVVPTRNEEPFGLIAAEANAFGLPVLVSPKGGLVEIIEHGYNGWIVETSNPDVLANYLEQAILERATLIEMGHHGRKRAAALFSKTTMINSIAQIIAQDVR